MVVEIYTFFWDLMGEEYFQMIKIIVELGNLRKGLANAWSFFYLNQDRKGVSNQKLETNLTLLNVTYKIYLKTLQMRLQPIFMEVMDINQIAFLLL
jgi:hypothetical protein